jgi:hypothetical protein
MSYLPSFEQIKENGSLVILSSQLICVTRAIINYFPLVNIVESY